LTFHIETTRLLIRGFTMDDLAAIHRIFDHAIPDWDDLSLAERNEWLQWTVLNDKQLTRLHQPPYGEKAVVLRETNELIGAVGLVQAVNPTQQFPHFTPNPTPNALFRPEFGLFWAIDPAYQGQGYATEAAGALVDWIFKHLRAERVIATTEYANEASQAVMRKLGMVIQHNPFPDPFWCQVVGILENPQHQ
jgi:ribosomal-protein-alanine N-acetyltransferase